MKKESARRESVGKDVKKDAAPRRDSVVKKAPMENLTTLIMEGKVTHPMDLLSCRFTKSGDEILTGSIDGVMRKINYVDLTMSRLYIDQQLERAASPITSIKFSPYSEFAICSYAEGLVKMWNLISGDCVRTIQESNQILGLGMSPLMRVFATAGDNAKLSLYDLETGQLRRNFEQSFRPDFADGHKSRVFAAKFHPHNPNELLSGGWDNTVQFWDIRQPSAVRYIAGPHICGDSIDIDWTGRMILTCSFEEEKNCCIWDYDSTHLLHDFTTDQSKNYCGSFLGKSYAITAASSPSLLRITNLTNWTMAATYTTPLKGLYSMDFFEPKSSKQMQAVKVITIASHILIKFKFIYRQGADFFYPQEVNI